MELRQELTPSMGSIQVRQSKDDAGQDWLASNEPPPVSLSCCLPSLSVSILRSAPPPSFLRGRACVCARACACACALAGARAHAVCARRRPSSRPWTRAWSRSAGASRAARPRGRLGDSDTPGRDPRALPWPAEGAH